MRPNKNKTYFSNIATQQIVASKNNPRKIFDKDHISELAKSFSEYGIIQPIIVFRDDRNYTIICGERRWRAAKVAKIKEVPAIVHPVAPKDEIAVSMALIENMHRQNVDLVSEATAIYSLVGNFGWAKRKIAKKLGVSDAYIRNRLLLTKYNDVLISYKKKQISFSKAIEIASLENLKYRKLFLERIKNNEFKDSEIFFKTISRHKKIEKIVLKGLFLKQPLLEKEISFHVKELPYCDSTCKYYLKLNWEEKKRFKIPTRKPGWSEYCVESKSLCYREKKEKKKIYLNSLRSIKIRRPIPYDGWESMQWFKYKNKTCDNCKYFIDSFDFEIAKIQGDKNVHAYCISIEEQCYIRRHDAYFKASWNRKKAIETEKKKRKQYLINQISEKKSFSKKTNTSYLTKAECAFLILNYLCYAGGENRLKNFAEQHSIDRNLPSSYNAKITYLRNKLIDTFKEDQLMKLLFMEAAASAAYSPQKAEPRWFDRKIQKEIIITGTEIIV